MGGLSSSVPGLALVLDLGAAVGSGGRRLFFAQMSRLEGVSAEWPGGEAVGKFVGR